MSLEDYLERAPVAQIGPMQHEGPQSLVRDIAPGEDYPVGSLGPLEDAARAVADITGAPIALAAQSALSIASLAVQGHGNVETLGGIAPASLFCLTIAASGERKSSADKRLFRGLQEHEQATSLALEAALETWQTEQKLWTARRDQLIKQAATGTPEKAAEAQRCLADLDREPRRPLSANLTATDPTFEGLTKLFLTGNPSLGIFSDEGGSFLGGHAMNADNRMKTVAGLSKLWDGEPINRTRAGDGSVTLYGRRLSAHIMAQPIVAYPLLSDPIANGQGFLARFLITEPPSNIGKRLKRECSPNSQIAEIAFARRIYEILKGALPVSEASPQVLEPKTLNLSDGAKELLWRYYETTEKLQAPGEQLEGIRPFASKSPEQAARIAAVLTLWGDLGAEEVTNEIMRDAITLAQFYLSEALRLVEASVVSQDVIEAERLRQWLLEKWPEIACKKSRTATIIVPNDILQLGPRSIRENRKIKALLAVLKEHGWLEQLPEGAEVDGLKRRTAYRIVKE